MSLIYNGTEIKHVIYNGAELDKVIHEGVTVFTRIPEPDPVFANNTPEQIQAAVRAGIAANLWDVGDKIPIKLQGPVGDGLSLNDTYYAYIIGFDHNKALESGGDHNIHLQFGKTSAGVNIGFEDSIYNTIKSSGNWFNMNNSATSVGGWKSSNMRNAICPAFFNAMPVAWQNVITNCTKYTNNTGRTGTKESDVTATDDKIWLLSEWEAFGVRSYANTYEKNKQIYYSEFYRDNNSRIKYKHSEVTTARRWWTRSCTVTDSNQFFLTVHTTGAKYPNSSANYGRLFAPCFQIS